MNLTELHRKMIAAARANPPGDSVPYAFEKRIMALLPVRRALDHAAIWARALWRAAAACLLVMLLLAAWSLSLPKAGPAPGELSQDFEKTMLAAVDQDSDFSW